MIFWAVVISVNYPFYFLSCFPSFLSSWCETQGCFFHTTERRLLSVFPVHTRRPAGRLESWSEDRWQMEAMGATLQCKWRCWEGFHQMLQRHLHRKWQKPLSRKTLTKHQFVNWYGTVKVHLRNASQSNILFYFRYFSLLELAKKKITFSQWKKITYMHKTTNSIINIVGYKKLIVKHLK